MKQIITQYGERRKMAKLFKTTPQLIHRALRFGSQSNLAQKVRKYALDNGGILIENNNN
jgi:hypothetical protein